MPTYEYRCKGCGRELEVVQSFDEPSLTVCPDCSGPLRKVFGSIGITFKGNGFYKTDNRSSGKKGSSSNGDSGSSSSSLGSGDSHSDGGHGHSHGDGGHTHPAPSTPAPSTSSTPTTTPSSSSSSSD